MLNHEPLRLADGEYRFACLVWDNEPLPSGQLVTLPAALRMQEQSWRASRLPCTPHRASWKPPCWMPTAH